MNLPGYRTVNCLQALAGILLILVAVLYFQNHLGLEPCYLCITQRVFIMSIAAVCTLAALHNPAHSGQKLYAGLSTSLALVGSYFSGKQLWLQSLPDDKVPACGPDLAYMMEAFPFQKMITTVLRGSGECAEVQWSLLGLSIPGWVLVVFAVMIIFQLLQLWKGDFTR